MLLHQLIKLRNSLIPFDPRFLHIQLLHLQLVFELSDVGEVVHFVYERHQVENFVHVLLCISPKRCNPSLKQSMPLGLLGIVVLLADEVDLRPLGR